MNKTFFISVCGLPANNLVFAATPGHIVRLAPDAEQERMVKNLLVVPLVEHQGKTREQLKEAACVEIDRIWDALEALRV